MILWILIAVCVVLSVAIIALLLVNKSKKAAVATVVSGLIATAGLGGLSGHDSRFVHDSDTVVKTEGGSYNLPPERTFRIVDIQPGDTVLAGFWRRRDGLDSLRCVWSYAKTMPGESSVEISVVVVGGQQ